MYVHVGSHLFMYFKHEKHSAVEPGNEATYL